MIRKRFLRTLLLFSAFCLLMSAPPAAAQIPTGKEYQVVLPAFIPYTEAQQNIATYRVEVMCSRKTQIYVKWGSTNYFPAGVTVNAGDRFTMQNRFPLPDISAFQQPSHQLNHSEVNNRVLVVTADQPITVHLTLDTLNRMESYGVMPVSAYDTTYTLSTFTNLSQYSERTGFVVVASQDGTVVRFTPSVETWDRHAAGVEHTIALNKNQAFSMQSLHVKRDSVDLTGTVIRANKPIGVIPFSITATPVTRAPQGWPGGPGNPIYWPEPGWYGKPVMEPQLSDSAAGTTFYTIPFWPHDTSLVRLVATRAGTTIDINGVTLPSTLTKGQKIDINFHGPLKITTSKPVVATQYAYSGGAIVNDTIFSDGYPIDPDTVDIPYGAPMMTQLLPIDMYSRAVQWITPNPVQRPTMFSRPPGNHAWEHYAIITAPVSTADTVMLDGKKVVFSYTHTDGNYVSTVLKMIPKQHVVEAEEPLSVIAYGFEWDDAYGLNPGEALRSRARFSIDTLEFISCDNELDTIITVENLGNNTFLIDSVKASGFTIKVLTPPEFPWQYQPGTSNRLVVVIQTPTPGVYNGSLKIFTDANNRKVWEIPVKAIRDSAQLRIPGSTLDFGVLSSTTTTVDSCFNVRNDGIRPLTLSGVTINGPGFTIVEPQTPITIAPGDSACIKVRFTPSSDGLVERTMRIVGTPCMTPIDVRIRGFKGGGASLGVQRAIDFPNYLCTSPAFVDSTIILKSIGDEPVEIKTAGFTGVYAGDYSFVGGSPQGQIIQPGGQIPVVVRFTPSGFGVRNAALEMTTNAANAPTLVIDLRARKDTAMIIASQNSLDFQSIKSCDDPVDLSLSISNNGTVPDTITSVDFGGVTAYALQQQLPIIVSPGITRDITVRFAPTADGAFPATMQLLGTPCGSEATISLSGSRIAPSLASNTSLLNFGTVYLCNADSTQQITLTNDGPVADTIFGTYFNGNPAFVLQESYPVIIEPGMSRTFNIRFTPGAPGPYNGQLTFEWGPCDRTTNIEITGQALDAATQISDTEIDFGTINVGSSARSQLTLRNTAGAPRTVSAIDLGGAADLKVTKPSQLPATIEPGDSLVIEVEYTPGSKGGLAAAGRIDVAAPCSERLDFTLKGTAVGDEVIVAAVTVAVPENLTGEVGKMTLIPIEIISSQNLAAAAPTSMKITVAHRYTMLAVQNVGSPIPGMTATLTTAISGNDRRTTITLSGGTFPATGRIATLEALTLLGDTSCAPIKVEEVEVTTPPNRSLTVTHQDGSFCSDGYCRIGGDRLVSLDGGLRLKPNTPNPFPDETMIEFELVEGNHVELVVVDIQGREVARLVDDELPQGSYSVKFNGTDLPAGLYFCELRGGGETLRETLILRP